ncbi:MAG TPA: hypothetical protein EYQ50_21215 [Verrucomicrobiales bacterium]|nr:hypothetical protein [Verrucomicrobiales bacterium]
MAKLKHGANQHSGKEEGQICPLNIQDIADKSGVSQRSIKCAKKVINQGAPELIEQTTSGNIVGCRIFGLISLRGIHVFSAVKRLEWICQNICQKYVILRQLASFICISCHLA